MDTKLDAEVDAEGAVGIVDMSPFASERVGELSFEGFGPEQTNTNQSHALECIFLALPGFFLQNLEV